MITQVNTPLKHTHWTLQLVWSVACTCVCFFMSQHLFRPIKDLKILHLHFQKHRISQTDWILWIFLNMSYIFQITFQSVCLWIRICSTFSLCVCCSCVWRGRTAMTGPSGAATGCWGPCPSSSCSSLCVCSSAASDRDREPGRSGSSTGTSGKWAEFCQYFKECPNQSRSSSSSWGLKYPQKPSVQSGQYLLRCPALDLPHRADMSLLKLWCSDHFFLPASTQQVSHKDHCGCRLYLVQIFNQH